MIFQTDTGDELIDDFEGVMTCMVTRIYEHWQDKRHAENIKQCVESVIQQEEEE